MSYPTDTSEERKITEEMAKTFNFTLKERHAACNTCGRRFQYTYVGVHLNERMIQHAQLFHTRTIKKG